MKISKISRKLYNIFAVHLVHGFNLNIFEENKKLKNDKMFNKTKNK
jgi:hypothetical protein